MSRRPELLAGALAVLSVAAMFVLLILATISGLVRFGKSPTPATLEELQVPESKFEIPPLEVLPAPAPADEPPPPPEIPSSRIWRLQPRPDTTRVIEIPSTADCPAV